MQVCPDVFLPPKYGWITRLCILRWPRGTIAFSVRGSSSFVPRVSRLCFAVCSIVVCASRFAVPHSGFAVHRPAFHVRASRFYHGREVYIQGVSQYVHIGYITQALYCCIIRIAFVADLQRMNHHTTGPEQ